MFQAYIFLFFDVDNIIHSWHFVNLVKNPNGLVTKCSSMQISLKYSYVLDESHVSGSIHSTVQ